VGELYALLGKRVQVRRLDDRMSKSAQIAIAEVIGEEEDDVRLGRSLNGPGRGQEKVRKQRKRFHA
jgi:hypothetical protein